MTKIYVVQARSFQYNDETYESSDGGNVMRAMFDTSVWVKAHRGGFDVDDFDHD
jgi:hypothetical protein